MKRNYMRFFLGAVVFSVLFYTGCPNSPIKDNDDPSLDDNADLSSLEISEGELSPAFSTDVTAYTLWEPHTVASITITPTAESDSAVIAVEGTEVASAEASGSIDLPWGPDTITVLVTAEDETATKTYTIEVYRASGVPKTGQTTQYDDKNDDGYLKEGVSWPSPRFTDNGDGTVTDNLTGLMWDRNGNRFGARTWAQAFDDIAGHAVGNYDDWRLPNVYELESLLNLGENELATWLNNEGFEEIQDNYYWTSTTYASDTTKAFMVRFDYTTMYGDDKTTKSHYVIAVRSD